MTKLKMTMTMMMTMMMRMRMRRAGMKRMDPEKRRMMELMRHWIVVMDIED